MKGYKAFNENLQCRGFQYEVGETYEFDGEPIPCKQGFHFCKNIADTYKFYPMEDSTRICEVEALGDIRSNDEIKFCTNKLHILREIEDVCTKKGNMTSTSTGYGNTGECNTGNWNIGDENTGNWNDGDGNTGSRNTGYYNTGNENTGYHNTGNRNIADYNTGNRNTGDRNTGCRNAGNCNTGNWNTGNWNAGSRNVGHYNTGDCNTGIGNVGDCNTGNGNVGDWNTSDWNTGCFNTEESKLKFFNKPSNLTLKEWRMSDAFNLLNAFSRKIVDWVNKSMMSDEEKEQNPSCEITRGYLKVLDKAEVAQGWWDDLTEKNKEIIMNIPNFDAEIFKKCTGIEVRE